ncbi:ABC transporter permease [Xylanibacillus composti]|nr:ABC transporter permease [Xylanibacillus composti]
MPMIRFLFRKMWNNRWLTLSTLGALVLAVAFTTSIPMYANGSLKRVVSESLQERNAGLPAGSLLFRYQTVGSDSPDMESYEAVDQYIEEKVSADIGFPVHNYVSLTQLRNSRISPVDTEQVDASIRRQMSLMSLTGLEDRIEVNNGVMYSDQIEDGVIEAIVLDESMYRNYFRVGDEFYYPVNAPGQAPLKVKVVGSFEPKDPESPYDAYWFQGLDGYMNAFLISEKVMKDQLMQEMNIPLDTGLWYYNFDLRDIQTSQLTPLTRTLDRMNIDVYQLLRNTRVDLSFKDMLQDFKRLSLQLQTLLFTLAVPMIAMVFYYITMNSRQTLERQRSDIAVLRSRGASTRQIIWIYTLEGLILGGVALVIGPMLGWFMAKSIGSSNGFLSFVDRKSIPVDVDMSIILYGVAAVVIALAASLIPAIIYARSSIVGLRQQMARSDRKPLWMRWYLDVLLIALSGYGWYLFNERQILTSQAGLSSDQLQVQPLLFFVPALTIFSLGLFFLRLFPWLLRLVNLLGRWFLPLPAYLTLTQLSRSAKAYYPLMLLLILTLGLGVYNSSSARTIDLNSTERTLYEYGTDVVLQPVWEGFAEVQPRQPPPSGGNGEDGGSGGGGGGGQQPPGSPGAPSGPPPTIRFAEPPFEIFKEAVGVESAARVLKTKGNAVVSGRTAGQGVLMGVDNVDFAKVGWFRDSNLLPHHQNIYLNLLGMYEQAVLIPQNFAERHLLEPGDIMTIAVEQQAIEFVVVGTIPYWPSLYPQNEPFFIVNLDYVYDQIPLIPYEVWIKMQDGALLTPMLEELVEKDIELTNIKDVRIELAQQQRLPSRGGVFGILSLGFLVSVLVSFIGYLLYWFFNLSSRLVQFGVLRAMGLSRRQLTGMLLLEQVFTAGLSIILGVLIGKAASYLYLPFLQTTEDARRQVPPFQVVFNSQDTMNIYIVVAFMMLTGAALLFMHIRRLRVHQAVKMGEER